MIRNLFRAIRMLGTFGLIVIIELFAIVLMLFVVDDYVIAQKDLADISYERYVYQVVEEDLLDMQVLEREYLIFDNEAEMRDEFGSLESDLRAFVDENTEFLYWYPDSVDYINGHIDTVSTNFTEIVDTYEADSFVDTDQAEAIFADDTFVNQEMRMLVQNATNAFETTADDVNDERWYSVIFPILALSLFPLLALWAFISASRITQPLLELSNAVTAISGWHYEPGMLKKLRRRASGIGQAAGALDSLAEALTERRSRLEQEVEQLRAELYEARRSRLDFIDGTGE